MQTVGFVMAAVVYLDDTSTPQAPPLNLPPSPPKAKSLFSWFPGWFPGWFPDWFPAGHCGVAAEPPRPPQRRGALTFQSRQRDDSHRFPQSFVREPLSLFSSFLSLLFFFFFRGAGNPAGKATNNGGDTHAEACEPGLRPRAPPPTPFDTPHTPPLPPQQRALRGPALLQPEKRGAVQKKKILSI